ncbi:class I poly(R)-hydroxyalkanoic acid synthase [Sedimenticola thiotaurini]|uniref:class I poly(R)-hydroxyalkanoic acid synthase n=1 Tax=Sedimenticola thiotaurini TaxID=1543721 RepID=UPI0007B06F51|nr:class I poly(R)-hydroxyalkanoic acid synthase [Sedimenticola thiotaurini]
MSKTDQSEVNTLGFASTTMELQKNFKQVEEIMANFAKSYENMDLDPFNLMKSSAEWYLAVAKDPQNVINANISFLQKSMELYQQSLTNLIGGSVVADPVITEDKGDRRFKHEDWDQQPTFNAIKQSYLLASKWLRDQVKGVEGLDEHTAEKVEFFTERYLEAMSPTNFAATNPAVIEKVVETKGANLVHGLKNMLEDLEAGKGELRIRMTDTSAFKLGENVATTPGKVIFQNRMFQLIQYMPSTDKVLKRPLLVVPPWINKYYIMDLQPKNSLLKWLVDQGHTVFVVSWVNPDSSYAETSFDDYVTEGVMTAVDVVEQATGESDINMIGYCIGGSLLATSLAYMKEKGDQRVKSATFFTTMIDFAKPGELGVFIDEEQICGLEKRMEETGYLDGSQMAGAFNLMRANDLIWSFYINNYLLGNDPRPFDLLYWNSDSTRMPAKMHAWYLRNFYLENNLCKPGGVTIDGVPIDISKVDIPVCFVSAAEDHIAPWRSTYAGAKLFSGDVRFILGGSGHIAGIINPPAAGKYNYRVTDDLPEDPESWAKEAEVVEGSWWPEWDRWVKALADDKVAARTPGDRGMPILEEAPGSYVKRTLEDTAPIPATPSTAADVTSKAKPAAPAQQPKESKKQQPDDLTAIKGIGPKLADVLNSAGIVSYAQLVELGSEGIKQQLLNVDERYARYDTSNWPEQAKALMA